MSELFLVLHKVRGEPAFDIAERITIGEEEGWIIPTSGHRAYPHYWWPLTELEGNVGQGYFAAIGYELPDDWPDHYSPKAEEPKPILSGLLDRLGLLPKIRRRI